MNADICIPNDSSSLLKCQQVILTGPPKRLMRNTVESEYWCHSGFIVIIFCITLFPPDFRQRKSRNQSWRVSTAAGWTLPTPSKAPKDSALWFVRKGKSPFWLYVCFLQSVKISTDGPFLGRYNVGCTKRMGLFHPEKNKQVSTWRRKSQGRASMESKKQVRPHILVHVEFPFFCVFCRCLPSVHTTKATWPCHC